MQTQNFEKVLRTGLLKEEEIKDTNTIQDNQFHVYTFHLFTWFPGTGTGGGKK